MLSEAALIALLKAEFPTHIGDDAAIIPGPKAANQWVITQDLLIEHVHFRSHYHDAASLAHKALHVNLSDLAAMGATPRFVMLALSIPTSFAPSIEQFINHFATACRKACVEILGGDTTRSEQGLFINVTALGEAPIALTTTRHSAKSGQILCVAGDLGYAHIGLNALERGEPNLDLFKHAFLYPQARVAEGTWLSRQPSVTAMMDLSDGLFVDANKLAAASNLAATLALDKLTPCDEFLKACQQLQLEANITQLIGGEDYALLIAVNFNQLHQLQEEFNQQFHYPLHVVGQLHDGQGLNLTEFGKPILLDLKPFNHF